MVCKAMPQRRTVKHFQVLRIHEPSMDVVGINYCASSGPGTVITIRYECGHVRRPRQLQQRCG